MELMLKATDQITRLDGVEVRLWEGTTERGIPCKVFVHRLAVHNSQDSNQFEQELHEKMPPGRIVPLSKIL
jgi:hypothetical protein